MSFFQQDIAVPGIYAPNNRASKYSWFVICVGLTFDFSTLQWCRSNGNSVEAAFQSLISFPGLVTHNTMLYYDAEQWQWPQCPASHEGKHLIL